MKVRREIINLIIFEFKETYYFPIFEALAAFCLFIFLQIQFSISYSISSHLISVEKFLESINNLLIISARSVVNILVGYNFALVTIIVPLIISYRISAALDKDEIEIILSSSVSRSSILSAKIITHTLINFIILTLPLTFNLYIEFSSYALLPINLPLLFLVLFFQTIYVTIISSLISILFKDKWILSSIFSVAFWFLIKVLGEMELIPEILINALPPNFTLIIFGYLSRWEGKYTRPGPFLSFDLSQVTLSFLIAMIIFLSSLIITFALFKNMSFER